MSCCHEDFKQLIAQIQRIEQDRAGMLRALLGLGLHHGSPELDTFTVQISEETLEDANDWNAHSEWSEESGLVVTFVRTRHKEA